MKSLNIRKGYLVFLASMLCFAIASALFRGVLDNYLAGSLEVSKSGRGVVEFFREMPGLLLFLILALLYRMPENRILRVGFIVALGGMVGFLLIGVKLVPAIFFLTLWSAGQHILMPVQQSFAIHSVPQGQEGSALGLLRSIQSIGRVMGFFIVPVVFIVTADTGRGFITTFLCVILFVMAAFGTSLFLRNDGGHVKRQRLYFRKKYRTYYIL